MRKRNPTLLPLVLLIFTLAAPVEMLGPNSGSMAFADHGKKKKAKAHKKGHPWKDHGRKRRGTTARREAGPTGGRVIHGDDRHDGHWVDDRWDDTQWLRQFESLDRTNDGYLSRSEWTDSDRIFRLLDVSDDGRLSRSEISNARSQPDRLENWFRASDINRDGRLGVSEWWGRYEAFARLDRNRDGFLSSREVKAGGRSLPE